MSDTKRIRVRFEVDVPAHVEDSDLMEWLEFELGYSGQMKISNPMESYDIEAVSVDISGY